MHSGSRWVSLFNLLQPAYWFSPVLLFWHVAHLTKRKRDTGEGGKSTGALALAQHFVKSVRYIVICKIWNESTYKSWCRKDTNCQFVAMLWIISISGDTRWVVQLPSFLRLARPTNAHRLSDVYGHARSRDYIQAWTINKITREFAFYRRENEQERLEKSKRGQHAHLSEVTEKSIGTGGITTSRRFRDIIGSLVDSTHREKYP